MHRKNLEGEVSRLRPVIGGEKVGLGQGQGKRAFASLCYIIGREYFIFVKSPMRTNLIQSLRNRIFNRKIQPASQAQGAACRPSKQPMDADADAGVSGDLEAGASFGDTLAHLGGLPAVAGAVLLLMALYVALAEWLLPRGRTQRATAAALRHKKRR